VNLLLNKIYKHLLYMDELGQHFLLTNHMEIFSRSAKILGCYCWHYKIFQKLRKKGIILNEHVTDDELYVFDVNADHLEILIECGTPKRRIYKNGKRLHSLEIKLGHRIFQKDFS